MVTLNEDWSKTITDLGELDAVLRTDPDVIRFKGIAPNAQRDAAAQQVEQAGIKVVIE